MKKILGSALSVLMRAAAGCNRGQVTPVAADSSAPTEAPISERAHSRDAAGRITHHLRPASAGGGWQLGFKPSAI